MKSISYFNGEEKGNGEIYAVSLKIKYQFKTVIFSDHRKTERFHIILIKKVRQNERGSFRVSFLPHLFLVLRDWVLEDQDMLAKRSTALVKFLMVFSTSPFSMPSLTQC